MGIDAEYQAMPDDCIILSRATQDQDFGNCLSFVPSAFERRGILSGPTADDPIVVELYALVREMMDKYPEIEVRRTADYSRSWDALHYLLSQDRRHGNRDGTDIGTLAILGGEQINGCYATQGLPIRFNTARRVAVIAAYLAQLTEEDLQQWYKPHGLEEQGVYKFVASDAPEQWEQIWALFSRLRTFYRHVADHGEGVLVVLD